MQAILDTLTRIPGLVWLSAGQLDGMTDSVLTQVTVYTVYGPSLTPWIPMSVTAQWMASGKCATLRSLDLDSSDNVTEEMLGKFLER